MAIITNIIDHNNWVHNQTSINYNNEFQFSKNVTAIATSARDIKPIYGHKYYGRCYQKSPLGFTCEDARFEWYSGDNQGVANLVFGNMKNTKGEWELLSSIQELTSNAAVNNAWQIRNFVVKGSNVAYRKELMIIDLTDLFGPGQEPTKEWCDTHIPYVEDTMVIPGTEDVFKKETNNTTKTFEYTGTEETYDFTPGGYWIECYGAQGGSAESYGSGGLGGYTEIFLTVKETSKGYINVGQQPIDSTGGYNGGGQGGRGGGGATHVAFASGLLSNVLAEKLIAVAGGGGGVQYYTTDTYSTAAIPGAGGGLEGTGGVKYTSNSTSYYSYSGHPGTQSAGGAGGESVNGNNGSAGSYGQGGAGYGSTTGGGGGGGYYGGGGGGYHTSGANMAAGGGGGSGFIQAGLEGTTTAGINAGHGKVTITLCAAPIEYLDQEENHIFASPAEALMSKITANTPTPPASILNILTIKKYNPFSTTFTTVSATKTTSFIFKEWNTEKDGSGITYLPGDSYEATIEEPLILYAIWEEAYTYSGINVGTASYNGYDFLGWSPNSPTDKNNLYTGTYIYLTEDTKALYPVFEQRHIRYVANGGNCPPVDSYISGSNLTVSGINNMYHPFTIEKRAELTLINGLRKEKIYNTTTSTYTFSHWNTQPNGSGTSYNPGAVISNPGSSLVLYAIWTKNSTNNSVLLPTPTKTGFGFNGWGATATATSGIKGFYNESTSKTLYATWNNQAEKVSYKPKIFQNNAWK